MSTANEILDNYQHVITELRLIPGGRGVFDVTANENLIFSKDSVGRHAVEGEVLAQLIDHIGSDVPKFHDN